MLHNVSSADRISVFFQSVLFDCLQVESDDNEACYVNLSEIQSLQRRSGGESCYANLDEIHRTISEHQAALQKTDVVRVLHFGSTL